MISKKGTIMRYLLGLSLLFAMSSLSYSATFAQWGVASVYPGGTNTTTVKFVEAGKSGEEGKLAYTVGVGGWDDNTGYTTKVGDYTYTSHSSFFAETLFGVEPKSDHFFISYKLGPAIISDTDALLGSNIQLSHQLSFGMRDSKEVRVYIAIKHFSNGGIVLPNKGRDFVGIGIEF